MSVYRQDKLAPLHPWGQELSNGIWHAYIPMILGPYICLYRHVIYRRKALNLTISVQYNLAWYVCHAKFAYCRVPPPQGSELRWREDMGGGLPNARESRTGWSLQPTGLQRIHPKGFELVKGHKFPHVQPLDTSACKTLTRYKWKFNYQ